MKTFLHNWFETLWWRESTPPAWLVAISRLYALMRDRDQAQRLSHVHSVNVPVISIGNITVGGSGKTPFVIWLTGKLIERGWKPVVLCRGDGGKIRHARVLSVKADAESAGDEAMLLLKSCACPVVAGQDRVAGAKIAANLGNLIVLDDGMQYRQLKRDCEVTLVPAVGIGNAHELPAGPLREPIAALERSDVVVRTGEGASEPLINAKEWHWQTVPKGLEQIAGPKAAQPNELLAMSAIARPQRFIKSLTDMGFKVPEHLRFPDHHVYTLADIRKAINTGLDVAVTSKDAVKLRPIWPKEEPLWLLRQEGQEPKGLIDAILVPILTAKQYNGVRHVG